MGTTRRVMAAALAVLAGVGMGMGMGAGAAGPATAPAVVLDGHGLSVGGRPATFDRTPRADATALVAGALGKPLKTGSHGDCGQGDDIGYARFRGGFELSFVHGRLSGWTADAATPKTAKGIGVGATVAALRRAYPDVDVDAGDEKNGGLGPSFQREDGPNGSLDGTRPTARVTGMFAGATCLPGV